MVHLCQGYALHEKHCTKSPSQFLEMLMIFCFYRGTQRTREIFPLLTVSGGELEALARQKERRRKSSV